MIQRAGRSLAEVDGCDVLHRTARLEIEIFGRVVSDSVADHVDECHKDLVVLSFY